LFDIKTQDGWCIFQTRIIDNHAVYRFEPNASVTFAFVFLADSDLPGAFERTPVDFPTIRSSDRRPRL
jgi:hypothetical protein